MTICHTKKQVKCNLVDQLIWIEQKENERNTFLKKIKSIATENCRTDLLAQMPNVLKCSLSLWAMLSSLCSVYSSIYKSKLLLTFSQPFSMLWKQKISVTVYILFTQLPSSVSVTAINTPSKDNLGRKGLVVPKSQVKIHDCGGWGLRQEWEANPHHTKEEREKSTPAWLTPSILSHLQCRPGPKTHIQAGSPHFS